MPESSWVYRFGAIGPENTTENRVVGALHLRPDTGSGAENAYVTGGVNSR